MSATVHQLRPRPDLRKEEADQPVIAPPDSSGAEVAEALGSAGTGRIARSRRKIAALEHTELPDFAGHTDPDIAQACLTCNPLHARAAAQAVRAARATPPATRATIGHTGLTLAATWRATGAVWRWVVATEFEKHRETRPEMVRDERQRRRKIAAWTAGGGAAGLVWLAVEHPVILIAAALVWYVAAGVAERRIRASFAPEDAGRKVLGKKPGSKAVRRVVAAAKLGKFDDIRIVGPVVRDGAAWTALVEPPAGVTFQAAQRKQAELAAAIGVGLSQVSVDPVVGHHGRFGLWVADSDPLGGGAIPSPLMGLDRFDLWRDKIPLMFDVRRRPIAFSLVESSILIGGEPGGGKSVACNNILCALALDPSVRLWLADGKGVDLLDFEDISEQFMARPDPAGLRDLLREAIAEMEDRYRILAKFRARKVTAEISAETGIRPLLLHVDELAFFTRSDLGDEITELLRDYVSRGRAALMMLSAATQRPSREVVKPDLRDLIPMRGAVRCSTPETSDMVLGRGWSGQGFSAAGFDPLQKGAMLLLAEGEAPVRGRVGLLTDNQVTALCRRAYGLREQAGTLPKSDARPAVRLLRQVLGVMGETERTPTAALLEALPEHTAESLADALRPLGVRPDDLWIDRRSQRGYRRADVMRALERA